MYKAVHNYDYPAFSIPAGTAGSQASCVAAGMTVLISIYSSCYKTIILSQFQLKYMHVGRAHNAVANAAGVPVPTRDPPNQNENYTVMSE